MCETKDYIMSSNKCVFGGTCHTKCATCNGPLETNCLTCSEDGYWAKDGICKPCGIAKCKKCYNVICTECMPGYSY